MKTCQTASRSCIKAYRVNRKVLIMAEGVLPTPGYSLSVEALPIRIFPQRYSLRRCSLPGVWPEVLSPYRIFEAVEYPVDQPVIHVEHADAVDEVKIKELVLGTGDGDAAGPEPREADGPDTAAVGFSDKFSFDEAFLNAIAALDDMPAGHPDQLVTVKVEEVGALFGGIAGFNEMYVRVSRTWDGGQVPN